MRMKIKTMIFFFICILPAIVIFFHQEKGKEVRKEVLSYLSDAKSEFINGFKGDDNNSSIEPVTVKTKIQHVSKPKSLNKKIDKKRTRPQLSKRLVASSNKEDSSSKKLFSKTWPMVNFFTESKTVNESAGKVLIPIYLTKASNTEVEIYLSINSERSDAKVRQDYNLLTPKVVFGPGETEKMIEIYLLKDQVAEELENLTIDIQAASKAIIGHKHRFTLSIIDVTID